MSDMTDFLKGYDDAPADQGTPLTPLPKGAYYFKVEKEIKRDTSKNGIPFVTYMFRVLEGPFVKRTMLGEFYLGASRLKDGRERSDEEFAKSQQWALGRWKGFLQALKVATKGKPTVSPADDQYIYQALNVDGAIGGEFIGFVKIEKQQNGDERNAFEAFRPLDHPKEGLAALRAKAAKVNATSTQAASQAASL